MSKKESTDWFTEGEETFQTEDKKHGKSSGFDPRNIYRFFMSKNNTEPRSIVFLDDEPFNVYMHQYEANGHWGNWETCPLKNGKMSDWCPLCQKQEEKQKVTGRYIGHYTIVDMTGYDDSDGKHHMPVKILPANNELVNILKLRKSGPAKGKLKGAKFSVVRTKGSKNSLGNDWTFERHIDIDKFVKAELSKLKGGLDYLPKEWGFWEGDADDKDSRKNYTLKGFPFRDILFPLDAEVLAAKMGGGDPTTYDAASYDSYDSDDKDSDDDEIAY
jgi:hypothetical protein